MAPPADSWLLTLLSRGYKTVSERWARGYSDSLALLISGV